MKVLRLHPWVVSLVCNSEAETQDYPRERADIVTSQQITGIILLVIGIAALTVSVGSAWILSRLAQDGRDKGNWLIAVASLLLFLVGIALCWFGVSTVIEGGA